MVPDLTFNLSCGSGVNTDLSVLFQQSQTFLELLLLSAFPISQGWPQRIIILHIFLSSMSISFTPTSFISSFTITDFFGTNLLILEIVTKFQFYSSHCKSSLVWSNFGLTTTMQTKCTCESINIIW